MDQEIGSCSLCGGPVVRCVGAWGSVLPPPPARCSRCGAEEARGPVIQMRPPSYAKPVNGLPDWYGAGVSTVGIATDPKVQTWNAAISWQASAHDRTGCAPNPFHNCNVWVGETKGWL